MDEEDREALEATGEVMPIQAQRDLAKRHPYGSAVPAMRHRTPAQERSRAETDHVLADLDEVLAEKPANDVSPS